MAVQNRDQASINSGTVLGKSSKHSNDEAAGWSMAWVEGIALFAEADSSWLSDPEFKLGVANSKRLRPE